MGGEGCCIPRVRSAAMDPAVLCPAGAQRAWGVRGVVPRRNAARPRTQPRCAPQEHSTLRTPKAAYPAEARASWVDRARCAPAGHSVCPCGTIPAVKVTAPRGLRVLCPGGAQREECIQRSLTSDVFEPNTCSARASFACAAIDSV